MSDQLRFAMVGAGWWAHAAHLPAIAEDRTISLAAVCDPSLDRANSAAADFGGAAAFTDVGEMLRSVQVDCAVVATPHTTHRPLVEQLLRAGVHVLVEKPMTTTAEDAWALVSLARSSGRHLSVGLTYQYATTAPTVRDIVRNDIGDLVSVNAEFSSHTQELFSGVGRFAAQAHDPAAPHGMSYADPTLSGGGQGQSQLTHLLGNLFWNTNIQAAQAFAYFDNRGLPVDIVNALTFRLDNGAIGAATSTGTTPSGVEARQRIRYHGTRGMVEHDLLKAEAWVFGEDGFIRHVHNSEALPSYPRREPVTSFARLVRGDGENRAPADLAAASVSLIEAAYISAAEGRPVDVLQGVISSDERQREETTHRAH
ncbi:MAG TPA: Gfo/Idh/MocA family oxidoreductase [Pseudolysinimonas sp.]|nr:Gfo/Idh/MocA family oxidoreductase [Pseudolysinimonas sp.]